MRLYLLLSNHQNLVHFPVVAMVTKSITFILEEFHHQQIHLELVNYKPLLELLADCSYHQNLCVSCCCNRYKIYIITCWIDIHQRLFLEFDLNKFLYLFLQHLNLQNQLHLIVLQWCKKSIMSISDHLDIHHQNMHARVDDASSSHTFLV